MSAYMLANSYSLAVKSPTHCPPTKDDLSPKPRARHLAARPSTSSGSSLPARRDTYTPLLSTIHMRHAMMKERIEQRWREVHEQLKVMKKEMRERRRTKEEASRAQTARLLGVEDAASSPAGTAKETRRDMAIAAGRAVEEGRLSARDIRERGSSVAPQSRTAEPASEESKEAGDAANRSDAKRKDRKADALFSSPALGVADEPSDDGEWEAQADGQLTLASDPYTQHTAHWEQHTLQPVFAPTSPLSPSLNPPSLSQPASQPISTQSPPPLTPRHAYSTHLSSTIKNLVALLMQLDKPAMSAIRSSFSHHPSGLSLYTFLLMATTYIRSCAGSREDIAALIEMFRDIDVNGDEMMEWDEFTSHLVQLASTYGEDTTSSQLPHFTPSIIEDTSTHDRVCDSVKYIGGLKKLIVFERNSRRFKVYSMDMKTLATVRGHRSPLLCCDYWEKAGMLLTSSSDKTLIFWSVVNGSNVYTMNMSWSLPASYVALRYAGGHTLFAADTNHLITQWHLERSEQRCVYRGHTDVVMDLVVLPHFNLLASCSLDSTVRLWDIGKGSEVSIMKGHTKAATLLAYHPDLKLLISAGLDRFALVWNPRVLAPVYTIQCASPLAHIVGLEVLGGSPELVIGDSKGGFMVYDLRSFSVIQQFSIPNLAIDQQLHSFTVSHAAGLLIAASAKLYQFKRTTGVRRHHADDSAVRFAAFNATRLTFITVAADNIKVWNALTGMLEREEKNFTSASMTSVCVDDKQRRIYVGCTDGSVYSLNYSSGAIMTKLQVHRTEVSALCYHAAHKCLLSGSWDTSLCLSDDKLSAVGKRMQSHTEDVLLLASSAQYDLVVSAAADLTISLHDINLGPPLIKWHLEHLPSALLFLDPYPLLLVADHSGGLSVFDTSSPFKRTALAYVDAFSRVPNGAGLAVGASITKEKLAGDEVGAEFAVGAGQEGSRSTVIHALCFVSQTGVLYTGDDAGYVKAWKLDAGLLSVFQGGRAAGSSLSRDGHREEVRADVQGEATRSTERPRAASVSMMQGSRVQSSEGGRVQHPRRSILRTSTVGAAHQDSTKQVQVNSRPTALHSPPSHHASSAGSADADVDDDSDDDDCHPAIQSEDVKLLSPALVASLLSSLSPHLIVRAHEDSCSGISYIARTLPDPSLLSFSFDGSVVLTSTVSGEHLGALMQGHNSRSEEREGGREWRFEYDLLFHRMKELELMRDGLRGGRSSDRGQAAIPLWLKDQGADEDDERGDQDSTGATVDRRMITPMRLQRAAEADNKTKQQQQQQQHASSILPSITSHPVTTQSHPAPSPVHVEHFPSLPPHARPGTASRLWVGGSYLELNERQTAAVDQLEKALHDDPRGQQQEEQKVSDEMLQVVQDNVGMELASKYGNWEAKERTMSAKGKSRRSSIIEAGRRPRMDSAGRTVDQGK